MHACKEACKHACTQRGSEHTGGGGGVGVAAGASAVKFVWGGGEKPADGNGESAEIHSDRMSKNAPCIQLTRVGVEKRLKNPQP